MCPPYPSPPGKGLATAWPAHDRPGGGQGSAPRSLRRRGLWFRRGDLADAPAEGRRCLCRIARPAQTWPDDHLVLVMDNVSYHRSPVVRTWWAEQEGRVTPLWLPVYTPNLNLMERVWRYLKQKLACHRFWADVEGLEAAASTLLRQIEAHFHPAEGPAIFLRKDLCEAA